MIGWVSFFNGDAREATATGERISADARHTVTNRDAREAVVSIERKIVDTRHAISDKHRFDITFVAVPRHSGIRTIVVRHFSRSADRQDARFSIKRPREVISLCAAGAAIDCGRCRQSKHR